jgi:hypothetical protein
MRRSLSMLRVTFTRIVFDPPPSRRSLYEFPTKVILYLLSVLRRTDKPLFCEHHSIERKKIWPYCTGFFLYVGYVTLTHKKWDFFDWSSAIWEPVPVCDVLGVHSLIRHITSTHDTAVIGSSTLRSHQRHPSIYCVFLEVVPNRRNTFRNITQLGPVMQWRMIFVEEKN